MFPFLRLAKEMIRTRRMAPLANPTDTHLTQIMCLPWDLDMFLELNNGRTLSLFDIGRLGMGQRSGMMRVLRKERLSMTMAGSSVRYRRRVHVFERVTIRSRFVCFDARFFYIEQSMWKRNGECANHVLYRAAVTDRQGIVPPERVAQALSGDPISPPMPDWIANWCKAEATRPWPPMPEDEADVLRDIA